MLTECWVRNTNLRSYLKQMRLALGAAKDTDTVYKEESLMNSRRWKTRFRVHSLLGSMSVGLLCVMSVDLLSFMSVDAQ